MRPFFLVIGALEVGCAIAQYLSAIGRLKLNHWPFVDSSNRTWQLIFSSGFLLMGLALLALGLQA